MKLKALRRICDEALSTIQPEAIWLHVDKLINIAEEAKRVCQYGEYATMGLAELIEDLETS